jgi:hypothetical protein
MCPDNMPMAIFWAFWASRIMPGIGVFHHFPMTAQVTVFAAAVAPA